MKPKWTEDTCDFAISVKLHMRKTIENRLLSIVDLLILWTRSLLLFSNRKIYIGTDMGENHLIRHTKHEKSKDLVHNISKSTIDSNLFSIVLRMCNLTDFAKSHEDTLVDYNCYLSFTGDMGSYSLSEDSE
jgi:hypothetical protein